MTTRTPPIILHVTGQRFPRDRDALLAENARLRDEVIRLRAGEEPADLFEPSATGGHMLWVLNNSTPEVRVRIAAQLMRAVRHSDACFEGNHDAQLRMLKKRVTSAEGALRVARDEARRLSEVSDGAGRGVALTLAFVLSQTAGGLV